MSTLFSNKHFSPLRQEHIGPQRWRLLEPLTYIGSTGIHVVVDAGFECDSASVPRIFWPLFSKTGKLARASWIHDWLYVTAKTRNDAERLRIDRIFRTAMKDDGVRWAGRMIAYRAVRRCAGLVFYRKRN